MHAKNSRPGKERDDIDSNRRHVAVVVRDRLGSERRSPRQAPRYGGVANELGDHALARSPDEYGIAERDDSRQLHQRGERMGGSLRESNAGIERDANRPFARRAGGAAANRR